MKRLLSQWSVGWVANGGALNVDQMPVLGFSRTYATNKLITDSCAGGTALANGRKTRYFMMTKITKILLEMKPQNRNFARTFC